MTSEAPPLTLDNPLWAFALDFYGRPDVSKACLTLQGDMGADVITLITVAYAWAAKGHALTGTELDALRTRTGVWRANTVLPLRRIRQDLKPPRNDVSQEMKETLRDQVKRAELAAERVQIAIAHAWLINLAPGTSDGSLDAALDCVVAGGGHPPTGRSRRALATIRSTLKR